MDPPPRLFDQEAELMLGDRDEGLVFGRLADVAVAPDGRVYVLDSGFGRVHVFDADGRRRGEFGEYGEGPGEFTIPLSLAVDPRTGHLLVGNVYGRVCRFTADGHVVDDIRFSWPGNRAVRSLAVADDGTVFVATANILDQTMIHAFSPEGERLRSFGETFAVGQPETEPDDEAAYAVGFLDLLDGVLIHAQKNPLEIEFYDPGGDRLATLEDPGFDVPYPPRVLQRDGSRVRRSLKGAWGLVASRAGFYLNVVVPVDDDLPVGGSIVAFFDVEGRLIDEQSNDGPFFVAAVDAQARVWAIGDQPFARAFRFPAPRFEIRDD